MKGTRQLRQRTRRGELDGSKPVAAQAANKCQSMRAQYDAKDSQKRPRRAKKVDKDFVGAPTKYYMPKTRPKGSKKKPNDAERRPREAK